MAFCVNKEHEQNSKILSEWTNEHEHSKLPILRNEQAKMNKFHEKIWKKYFWKKPVQLEWLVLTRKITFYSWIEQIFLKIQLSLIQSAAFKFFFHKLRFSEHWKIDDLFIVVHRSFLMNKWINMNKWTWIWTWICFGTVWFCLISEFQKGTGSREKYHKNRQIPYRGDGTGWV